MSHSLVIFVEFVQASLMQRQSILSRGGEIANITFVLQIFIFWMQGNLLNDIGIWVVRSEEIELIKRVFSYVCFLSNMLYNITRR